ncbi:MAG: 2-dehydro-3-deoxy-D-gluconate 5-dehydrogenase KduD [Blastocatellia bacterium]
MILNKFNLEGKVAIVTGASTGLGQGMAIGLAEAGADVLGAGSKRSFAQTQEAVEKLGRRFVAVKADLAGLDSVSSIVSAALDHFGKIDILVNNAAGQRRKAALEFTEDDWDYVHNINLKTLYFLSQAVAQEMLKQKCGKIINVCSVLSFQGGLRVLAYTASKGGVAQLTKALANELAPHGINVNGIAPGYMATELNMALLNDPVRLPQINARIPAGRWGTPEDLKGAVVYLASRASDYMHGHVLVVDGGWMSR